MRTMTTGEMIDDDGADGRATVVISSPEELIASRPAMLGVPPGRGSVVVLCGETADGGQKLLFSATLDSGVANLVTEFLHDPSVYEVAGEDRVEELARLLSGHEDSTTALAHARELLEASRVAP